MDIDGHSKLKQKCAKKMQSVSFTPCVYITEHQLKQLERLRSEIPPTPHDYPYYPDSKVHAANMGPIWGRQVPGGSHVGPMNFAIWVVIHIRFQVKTRQSQSYKF